MTTQREGLRPFLRAGNPHTILGLPEGWYASDSKPGTRNPKETRNLKPKTRNPKPEARNPKNQNSKPKTLTATQRAGLWAFLRAGKRENLC
jgi:hypothetical protein